MSEMLTAEERAAIRARADAATEGPWRSSGSGRLVFAGEEDENGDGDFAVADTQPRANDYLLVSPKLIQTTTNNKFIAAARTDVPRLLDDLEALHAKMDQARSLLERLMPIAKDDYLTIESLDRHQVMPYGSDDQAKVSSYADRAFVLLEDVCRFLGVDNPIRSDGGPHA